MNLKAANKVIPKEDAAQIIHRLLPDDRPGWRKNIFSPDYVIERAITLGASLRNTRVPRWEEHHDEELVDMLLLKEHTLTRDVLVVTDLCLGGAPPGVPDINGIFVVNGPDLDEFILSYRQQLTPHFIDGDVLLISPHDRKVIVFHHEGMITHLDMRI